MRTLIWSFSVRIEPHLVLLWSRGRSEGGRRCRRLDRPLPDISPGSARADGRETSPGHVIAEGGRFRQILSGILEKFVLKSPCLLDLKHTLLSDFQRLCLHGCRPGVLRPRGLPKSGSVDQWSNAARTEQQGAAVAPRRVPSAPGCGPGASERPSKN